MEIFILSIRNGFYRLPFPLCVQLVDTGRLRIPTQPSLISCEYKIDYGKNPELTSVMMYRFRWEEKMSVIRCPDTIDPGQQNKAHADLDPTKNIPCNVF